MSFAKVKRDLINEYSELNISVEIYRALEYYVHFIRDHICVPNLLYNLFFFKKKLVKRVHCFIIYFQDIKKRYANCEILSVKKDFRHAYDLAKYFQIDSSWGRSYVQRRATAHRNRLALSLAL